MTMGHHFLVHPRREYLHRDCKSPGQAAVERSRVTGVCRRTVVYFAPLPTFTGREGQGRGNMVKILLGRPLPSWVEAAGETCGTQAGM